MDALELKIPPVLQVLLVGLAMWFAAAQLPSVAFAFPWHQALGILVIVAGLAFGATGALTFRKAKTTVLPHDPHTASSLVTTGIYRFTRNPMYVGLAVMLMGWAVFLANWVTFLFVPLFIAYITRFQIIPEEHALAAKFGEEFDAYKQAVRRWL